ncbi:CipA protein [Colletotrichum truncatum]|uniref:CipA protein n=1 Tax=Colletotrichum truncatum TaxID=5467 RepID=A0ACC3Z1U4_COLTU|nr:CipA protein [Colletotrichum truncatum]KAF6781369.1 CipA protein [Colletotrichum truncatum]
MAHKFAKDEPKGFNNSIQKVAAVGAGGQIGRPIAEQLLKTGKHAVTALTRAGSNSPLPPGVKVASVDYDNESSLVDALKGQEFLVITLSLSAKPGTHSTLVRAAAKAGVQYVMPNAYSINFTTSEDLRRDIPVSNTVLANISEIQQLGMTSITLMNGFWYEYSLIAGPNTFGFDLDNRVVTFYDDGLKPINASTWLQCGRAVAALLSLKVLPEDADDKSMTISHYHNNTLLISSFKVSQRDMLDSIQRVTNTTDKDWKIYNEPSSERYKAGVKEMEQGKPEGFYKSMYARVFYPSADADFESHGDRLGLPVEDLDESTRFALSLKN